MQKLSNSLNKSKKFSFTLTHAIFVALFLGFIVGVFLPSWAPYIKPFRGLFLNGVKSIIAPLIFSTIVTGIAGAGSFKQLGRMGVRAFVYFEVVTTLALVVGLLVVNLLKPGHNPGLDLSQHMSTPTVTTTTPAAVVTSGPVASSAALSASASAPKNEVIKKASETKMTFGGFVEHLLPTNIADAIVRGDVLQIVIFSTLFAFAVLAVGERARPVLLFAEGMAEVMFKFTGYIMYLAPLGVGAALAASVAEHGWQVIVPLFKLVGALYLALVIFVVFILLPIAVYYKIPIRLFVTKLKDAIILAFATTSSESAYPMALSKLEEMNIPRRISSFVLPMGYSFNLDGSTLYLAMAAVFVAQAAHVELPISTQLVMMATLMLTTKGVAAVPRASLVVLSGTLTGFGLPLEGIALILGVDEFMDMARTAVNLLGNCLATAVIARTEGVDIRDTTSVDATV